MRTLRLATRGSALALAQTRVVAAAIAALPGAPAVELRVVRSEGDQRSDAALSEAGGTGLFTRALEDALLAGEADAAVHSLKDLPTALAPGLGLAAVGAREDWRDAWICATHASPRDLPPGALVGTGSPRRRAQLLRLRPDLRCVELRGNVDTRLRKVAQGEVQGAVLALAGLRRLGLEGRARAAFGEEEMLPAPGQGFVAVEAAEGGGAFDLCRAAFHDPGAAAEAACERAFLERLRAGCMAPVGALARRGPAGLELKVFAELKAGAPRTLARVGPAEDPRALGLGLAEALLADGG